MDLDKVIQRGVSTVKELTGLKPSTVTGISLEAGKWLLSLEMVEMSSIPNAMDILGLYDVQLDENGSLLSFQRRGLRRRGDTPEGKLDTD
ncbi:MAG: gas vesicle protein [Firmicutes bacterium]|nr:gas vesicle protein [Bacillota bacterium]MCL5040129.1 gas vesicle protein [Bacillota bacterium]